MRACVLAACLLALHLHLRESLAKSDKLADLFAVIERECCGHRRCCLWYRCRLRLAEEREEAAAAAAAPVGAPRNCDCSEITGDCSFSYWCSTTSVPNATAVALAAAACWDTDHHHRVRSNAVSNSL